MFEQVLTFFGFRDKIPQATDEDIKRHWRYLSRVFYTRRQQLELSITQLASSTSVSKKTIRNFEKRRRKTRVSTIRKLAVPLGLDLNFIIWELEK